jgi:2-oxoglutarate dehydrogenase E1 component
MNDPISAQNEVNKSLKPVENIGLPVANSDEEMVPLRGGMLRVVENMEASLAIPTATSYRSIPVNLLEENRRIINSHMERSNRGKVSFTHLIAWAIVCSLRQFPSLNACHEVVDGEPYRRMRRYLNLGVAVDI